LVLAPTDAQQGEVYRIIFIHVPAAWMSMFIYLVLAFWSAHCAQLCESLPPTLCKTNSHHGS
jgi:ABC-type transport system involved in cytochrome c biogenesis permease subunit